MASESYRMPPEQPAFFDYSDPRMHHPQVYDQHDTYRNSSRESSRSRDNRESSRTRRDANMTEKSRYSQPHQPINEAVSSAFDKADPPNQVPPELIAQITESVLKQLKSTNIDNVNPLPPSQQYPPPPPQQPIPQPMPQSPSTHSGSSPPIPRNVYTPPSPSKHGEYPNCGSPGSHQSGAPQQNPTSPREPSMSQFYDARRPPSRQSQSSDSSNTRPKGPMRLSTGKEETTLEKIWGQLFDEAGHPTVRLGQLLRGLAIHLIEDYEPRHSLVVTPIKMIKYYADVKLPSEIYPWSIIFDDESSSISRMYRDLECQHHLVQERYDLRPDIPGLTPIGFERWMTLMIQAHPEVEYERLQKAVLDMPISNPDDKKERFPKEISRRLFPGHGDAQIQDRMEKSMAEHAHVDFPKQANTESIKRPVVEVHRPEQHRPSNASDVPPKYHPEPKTSAEPVYIPGSLERERKPYSTVPSESIIDDINPIPPPSKPIERERKPYSSQPGGGQQYEDDMRTAMPSKPGRSNSTATSVRPIPIGAKLQRPLDGMAIPEIHQHRGSFSRRRHSPSFSDSSNNDMRRSDGDIRGPPAPMYHPASIPTAESMFGEDGGRRYARDPRADFARRQAEEGMKMYGESPSARPRYDPRADPNGLSRAGHGGDEEYYTGGPRGSHGSGYEYSQSYGGPTYR